jgi:hypothetical protein
MIIFKGKKAKIGPVHTMDITTEHLQQVFFPKDFYEKYRYLGSVPSESKRFSNDMFYAIRPLVIYLDYLAKPWWCPRWFLRFLYLFGNDNSIVRMRNARLSRLFDRITKGYGITDYKTKWTHYDLRISIRGTEHEWWLASAIEEKFYSDGRRKELLEDIRKISPARAEVVSGWSVEMLKAEFESLEKNQKITN